MRDAGLECAQNQSHNPILEDHMKAKAISLALPFVFVAMAMGFADSPQLGTWKLNEAKSKIPAGAPKNTTVIYEAVGDQVKITVDGVDSSGNPAHNEWTGKFDGKEYPVTGDPTSDVRSYKQVNNHTLTFTSKKAGKVTVTGRIVVSANGKTRTVTTRGTNPQGKKVTAVSVFDKQ
jgi:hypothetical protein